MCPRTLDETDEVSKLDDTSDLTKAKVSYVKPVVEESVKRKMEMVQRQSEFNFKFLAELLSQMLTLSTVYYKLLLDSLGNHYTAWTRSKIYRWVIILYFKIIFKGFFKNKIIYSLL